MKMVKPIWRRVFFHLIFLNSTEALPQTADQIEQGFPCILLASILNWKIDYKNLTKVIQDSRGHDWYFRKQTKDPRVYFLNTVISTPVRFWLSLLLYQLDFSWKSLRKMPVLAISVFQQIHLLIIPLHWCTLHFKLMKNYTTIITCTKEMLQCIKDRPDFIKWFSIILLRVQRYQIYIAVTMYVSELHICRNNYINILFTYCNLKMVK